MDELDRRLRGLQAPAMELPPPEQLVRRAARRRRATRVLGAAAVVAALLLAVPAVLPGEDPDVLQAARAGELGLDPAVARMLVLDGQEPLACATAPLSALVAEPGAERADAPDAAELRRITREGIAGMSFPEPEDWVVLRRTETMTTFGRRVGPVGLGSVVSVQRADDGTYAFFGSGGCGPIGWADGRTASGGLGPYEVEGLSLLLEHSTDSDCGAPRDDPRVQVVESDRLVSVLVVEPLQDTSGACAGTGLQETLRVALERPLGDRQVVNAGYLPVREVLSRAETAAEAALQARRYEVANALCLAGAEALGGTLDVQYDTDVASVLRHVPEVGTTWDAVPADAIVAHCYLDAPDGATWAYVAGPGVAPVVYDRAYDRGGLFVRLEQRER